MDGVVLEHAGTCETIECAAVHVADDPLVIRVTREARDRLQIDSRGANACLAVAGTIAGIPWYEHDAQTRDGLRPRSSWLAREKTKAARA